MTIQESCSKLPKYIVFGAVGEAFQAGLASYVGTKVLDASGCAGYESSNVVATEAIVGGCIAGGILNGLNAFGLFNKLKDKPVYCVPSLMVTAVALPVFSTMLGYALYDAISDSAENMSLNQSVAATATGNGILVGGCLVTLGACVIAIACSMKDALVEQAPQDSRLNEVRIDSETGMMVEYYEVPKSPRL